MNNNTLERTLNKNLENYSNSITTDSWGQQCVSAEQHHPDKPNEP